jgi:RND superfamily putative drug exporter
MLAGRHIDEHDRLGPLEKIGLASFRHFKAVLVTAALLLVAGAVVGAGVINHLAQGGFTDASSQSVQAENSLVAKFHNDVPDFELVVSSSKSLGDPAVAAAGKALDARLSKEPGVGNVLSYWTAEPGVRSDLRGTDGRTALIVANVIGDDDTLVRRVQELTNRYEGTSGPVHVGVAGLGPLENAETGQISQDLEQAEEIAVPLTLLALIVIFQSAVAAMLPVAIGGVAVVGTLVVLRVLATLTPVSIFALNITTALGLGLAIDYSLFTVSRYRSERARGLDPEEAVRVTMRTAGRTVLFSGAAVATALCGLLVFPLYYLTSIAYAGVAVVVVAAIGALVLIPAMLALLGDRIDALSIKGIVVRLRPRAAARAGARLAGESATARFWERFAALALRRPVAIVAIGVGLLLVLGTPFLHASTALSDDRGLPDTGAYRKAEDLVRRDFPVRPDGTIYVTASAAGSPAAPAADPKLSAYAERLSLVRGVSSVQTATGIFEHGSRAYAATATDKLEFARGRTLLLAVNASGEPFSPAAGTLAQTLRGIRAPYPVQVSGVGAEIVDTRDAMSDALPWCVAIMMIATFVTLLVLTRSLLAPIKAIVLNALSLTAAFGALVYVFQEGHLQWLVGHFTATGSIDMLSPPLILCVAFGLSMDYEVFMLSRIREEHGNGADTATAVGRGLRASGPLITAAAALMALVFISFATSGVTAVKEFGVGMALAVVVDATIVRAALVPAIMRLAGGLNWWLPKWLLPAPARVRPVLAAPAPSGSLLLERLQPYVAVRPEACRPAAPSVYAYPLFGAEREETLAA